MTTLGLAADEAEAGISDLERYAGGGADELQLDLFVDGWPS